MFYNRTVTIPAKYWNEKLHEIIENYQNETGNKYFTLPPEQKISNTLKLIEDYGIKVQPYWEFLQFVNYDSFTLIHFNDAFETFYDNNQ